MTQQSDPRQGNDTVTSLVRHAAMVTTCVASCLFQLSALRADPLPPEQITPPDPPTSRPLHWSIGAGGFYAITGPASTGPSASADVYPGGWFRRAGARVEYRGLDQLSASLVMLGVTYEAAVARPKLSVALHGGVGVAWPNAKPVMGAGVHSQLWLWGPIALGYDTTAYVFYDGVDSELAFAGTFTVRVGR